MTMTEILDLLKEITIPALIEFEDPALAYFTKRDLAGESSAGGWQNVVTIRHIVSCIHI